MSERFGDLILLEKLAAGGMAEVYRAKQIGYGGFEKTVAVKRILPNFASDEEFKSMFRQEANLSACLQHQSIVQVFGNGEFEGYLYLVMEFVDGKNVRQILSRCERKKLRIPIELSLFIIAETAKGLNYAHQYCDEKSGQPLNIVHRDMSPQNVMVGYDASVKIVDFGIAKAASWADTTRAGVLKGKFGYMSPEQARGEKLDSRTDIFALGIILFETLTQRRLFTSEDDLRTIKMVKECNVPRPSKYNPSITSQLDRIVMKALEKNKADRYQTAQELYEDIIVYLNQKYPKFVPTELSKYLRDIFKEDIEEQKKKREKQAAEAPAILGSTAPKAKPKTPNVKLSAPIDDQDKTDAGDEDDEKTQLSQSNAAAKDLEAKPLAPPAELDLEVADKKDSGSEAPSEVKTKLAPSKAQSKEDEDVSLTSSGIVEINGASKPTEKKFNSGPSPLTLKTNTALTDQPAGISAGSYSRTSPKIRYNDSQGGSSKSPLRLLLVASISGIAFYYVLQNPTLLKSITSLNHPATQVVSNPDETETKAPEVIAQPENSEPKDPSSSTEFTVNIKDGMETQNPEATSEPEDNRPPASVPSITLREIQGSQGPFGRIRLNTIPKADEFYVNGKLVVDEGGVPLKISGQDLLLPPGELQIELKNKAFDKKWKGSISIRPDVRQEKDIVFR